MSQLIDKIVIPFQSTQMFMVPQDAVIINVTRDIESYRHAAVWYTTKWVPIDERDEVIEKPWSLSVVDTEEVFGDECVYLGSVLEQGYAYHVVRVGVSPSYPAIARPGTY